MLTLFSPISSFFFFIVIAQNPKHKSYVHLWATEIPEVSGSPRHSVLSTVKTFKFLIMKLGP